MSYCLTHFCYIFYYLSHYCHVSPPGSYCELGSAAPINCPDGTYGAATGLKALGECTPCTAGQYCETPGLTAVEGPCEAGYYCELGSNSRRMAICTAGNYCPAASATPTACPIVSVL